MSEEIFDIASCRPTGEDRAPTPAAAAPPSGRCIPETINKISSCLLSTEGCMGEQALLEFDLTFGDVLLFLIKLI